MVPVIILIVSTLTPTVPNINPTMNPANDPRIGPRREIISSLQKTHQVKFVMRLSKLLLIFQPARHMLKGEVYY